MKRNYKINSVVFFPRNAEDTGIMPDDIITLIDADCTDVPPERMVAYLLIEGNTAQLTPHCHKKSDIL